MPCTRDKIFIYKIMSDIKKPNQAEAVAVVKEISSEAEFHQIKEGDSLIFVYFYANWCGPCKRIAPQYQDLAETYPNYAFLKINVDDFHELSNIYNIRSMPTFIAVRNGQEVDRLTSSDKDGLTGFIKSIIEEQNDR